MRNLISRSMRFMAIVALLLASTMIAVAQHTFEDKLKAITKIKGDKTFIYAEGNNEKADSALLIARAELERVARKTLNIKGDVKFASRRKIVYTYEGKVFVFVFCKKTDVSVDELGLDDIDDDVVAEQESGNAMGVSFTFRDNQIVNANGTALPQLVAPMARNISMFLTETCKAYDENRDVDFEGIKIDDKVKRMFASLWKKHPFKCDNNRYELPALCDVRGFQVRDIDVTERGADDMAESSDKQLCISFDATGLITGINFAISSSVFKFTKQNPSVTDRRRELEIRQFIETFRNYYINHDLEALTELYSDDAIIITGKVTMRRDKDNSGYSKMISYKKQNKKEYLASLKRTFQANPFIDVKFDEVKLSQHPTRPNVYGVNLVQTWNSKSHTGSTYNDVGYLHLLFDFPDHDNPRIHVRTWQPLDTKKEDIITINSYDD